MNIARLVNSFVFKKSPIYAHYGITHRCNLRCRMCKIYKDGDENDELSLEKIEKVFDFLRHLGVVYVSIGGGEPFLRKDLPLIVELLRKKGFMARVLTNGTLSDEDSIKKLVAAGLKDISISLDTLDPEKQDYIYASKGVFDKIMRAIDLFSMRIPKKRRLLLINTVVSPFNIKELPELALFARRKGYYASFVPVESNGNPEFKFKEDDYKEIDESYGRLIKMKEGNKSPVFNSSLFLQKSREYLKTGCRNWQCDAGKLYFSINPKGEFSICHGFKPEAYLLKQGLKAFLASREFEDRRRHLIKECPGCMRPCWAEVSFLMKDKKSFWEMAGIKIT